MRGKHTTRVPQRAQLCVGWDSYLSEAKNKNIHVLVEMIARKQGVQGQG